MSQYKISAINKRLSELEEEKTRLLDQRAALKAQNGNLATAPNSLSTNEKIDLFRELFSGRTDIYAFRWENKSEKSGYALACNNEWVQGLCHKPKIKCSDCAHKAFKPVTEKAIYDHLLGAHTIGIYPLLENDSCHFLAIDLDKSDWQLSTRAISSVCSDLEIPHAIEKSRSGNGVHIWIFFDDNPLAKDARALGFSILDKAMESYPELSFESYDRLFPNQDFLPTGGFGNLIALPMQRQPRQQGNSIFLDKDLSPQIDQWFFLKNLKKLSNTNLHLLLQKFDSTSGKTNLKPWEANIPLEPIQIDGCPDQLKIILANQIYIPITHLPAQLIARLKRHAGFSNPAFFKTQAMRLSTGGIPRYINLARIEKGYLAVPRGCLDAIKANLLEQNIDALFDDKRKVGTPIKDIRLQSVLRTEQKAAVKKLVAYNTGVLHAPTAFGKTITAIGVITARKTNTLILTHTRQLADQWKERLSTFIDGTDIGIIARGKRKPTGGIDIATYQSLLRPKNISVDPIVHNYGQIVIDECHHLSAPNYERLLSEIHARYVLGLTATPERRDGHQPIIFMQSGPIRHKVKSNHQNQFEQIVITRHTNEIPNQELISEIGRGNMSEIYQWLLSSKNRNSLIVEDAINLIQSDANPLIITERREHVEELSRLLTNQGYEVAILQGRMSKTDRISELEKAQTAQIIVATSKYIGEGFDLPRLDSLLLALPISWKGSLAQYAGRIHRTANRKEKVAIYDYVDNLHPTLNRMFKRRCKGYEVMGYRIVNERQSQTELL